MIWSDLKDLEPAAGGGFDSLGFIVELAGHKHVTRWGSADVLIGADLGIFATQSNIPGITENFTQRGFYLTPSIKFRLGERGRRYLNLEAGLGWYQVDFAELICEDDNFNNIVCIEIAEPYDEDTLGGYLGISGGFGGGFIMGLKVHFADFGEVTGLGLDTGQLKGPIYILSLGAPSGTDCAVQIWRFSCAAPASAQVILLGLNSVVMSATQSGNRWLATEWPQSHYT